MGAVILTFLIYVFAILILYAAIEHFRSGPGFEDEAVAEGLKTWYGGVYLTMSSLFMAVSGGADWADLMEPLKGMYGGNLYGPLYIGYIFFMYFGVLNVVVGAF